MSETKINASQTTITASDIGAAPVYDTMPTAAVGYLDKIVQYVGATDSTYTNGYFYKCVSDGQNPATYSWSNVQVQPSSGGLPSQTGHSGEFLTTDGTSPSWSDKPLVNMATGTESVAVSGAATKARSVSVCGAANSQETVVVGVYAQSYSNTGAEKNVLIGKDVQMIRAAHSIAIGQGARVSNNGSTLVEHATQIGSTGSYTYNNDSNTVKFANANGNFEIMSADGTIPTDRFTTTPSADGTYYPTLSISSGTPTRSWSTIAALQNTATGTSGLGILGTTSGNQTVVIGDSADGSSYSGVVIEGYNARATSYSSVAIGSSSSAHQSAVAVGKSAAALGVGSIQLGQGTNNTAGTFQVGLTTNGYSWTQYELLSSDGTIPTARLTNAINKYSSMPTAGADYLGQIAQFTGTTDATYTHGYIYECVSDGGNPPTYSWTAVSVQAGGGSLPSQTGNSGKFLTTDGTDASWGNALTNTGTGTGSFATGTGATTTDDLATAIGENASAGYCSTVVGSGSSASATSYGSVIIGQGASVTGSAYDSGGTILIQAGRSVNKNCIIIGRMQPGVGNYQGGIFLNSTNTGVSYYGDLRDTFWITVGTNSQYKQYQITDANGRFPIARMADTTNAAQGQVLTLDANNNAVWQTPSTAVTSTTATLAVNDWSSNTQTVNVTGVTANNLVQVAPAPSSNSDYVSGGVLCTAQGVGTLTFTCTTTPTNAITVNVVIFG